MPLCRSIRFLCVAHLIAAWTYAAATLSMLGLGAGTTDAAPAAAIQYPATRADDVKDDYHGTEVADPYRWLEDTDAAETGAWVRAQNEVTFDYLQSIPEREGIRSRLTELWNYERYGMPVSGGNWYFSARKGDWYVFAKNDGLQNQSVVYKRPVSGGEASVFIDPNTLAADGTTSLVTLAFSKQGRLAVYGTSEAGSDWREFRVRNVTAGTDLPDHLRHIKFSDASWTRDERGFFYSRYPEPKGDALTATNHNHALYYHVVGTDQSLDRLVYARPDQPELGFAGGVSDDGRYLVIGIWHGTERKNRIHFIDLGDPAAPRIDGPVVRLLDDADARYEFVGNDGPVFFFFTDAQAPRGRVIAIDTRSPSRDNWKTVVPEGDDTLVGVSMAGGRFVARYLADAHSVLRVFALSGAHEYDIALPALGTVDGWSGDPDQSEAFFSFTSFLYPTTIFRHDFESRKTEVVHAPKIGFDASAYETRQVFYTSKDGTRIPMFLTHKKGIARDGTNPTLLYGYGGFNVPQTPQFSVSNLVWLEMGGIYALANLRGGGEYGADWHAAGKLDRKQNVFDDFVAAGEYLIAERYTSRERLAIHGRSNGGLLVGAVLNQRPDLFGAALPTVGVMDMLRFHKFTIGWGWTSDYGSSDDPEGFRYLRAYSPLHNVKAGAEYPPTLITTADHDDRVVPGHSFKYAAAMQAAQGGDAPVLIRIDTSAGHGSGKPTSKLIEERADMWAFVVKALGMKVENGKAAPRL